MDRRETKLPISSENLLKIRDYWISLRQHRPMPTKSEFSPSAIARYLPYVALVDVFQEPLRFRYRLLGTRITDLAGRNATGKWLDEELYGDRTEDMLWMFKNCVSTEQPVAIREQVQFVDKSWVNIDVAAFPLCDEDGKVTVVLSAVDLTDVQAKLPSPGTAFILNWNASGTLSQSKSDAHSTP